MPSCAVPGGRPLQDEVRWPRGVDSATHWVAVTENQSEIAGPPPFSLAQRVAFATGLQVVGKIAVLAFALVSIRISTNYLGVDAYGDFAIVLTGATLVLAAGDLGLTTLLARELSKDPARSDETAGNLLFLRLASVAVIMVLALLTVPLLPFPGRVREGLVLAIAGSLLGVVALFPTAFFQVHLRLGLAVTADLVVRGLALLLMVAVVVFDKGFIALVAATPVAWAAGVVIAFALSRRFWHPNVRFDPVELKRLVGIAAPVSLVVTLGLVHFKVDAVMMSFLQPAADVGIYTIAYAAVEQSLILPGLFMAAVFPILTRLVHDGDLGSGDVVDKSFRFLTVLGLLVAVLVFTLAVPFVHLVASASYAAAVTPLQILAFSIVPLFAGAVFANLLVSMGDLRDLAIVSAIGIVVNVTLNLYFISAYSYNGAAATTVFSEVLGFVMIYAVARRATRVPLARETVMRGALLVAVVVAVVVPTLLLPWWLAAPLAVCACAAASIGTRTMTRADVQLLLHRRPAPPDRSDV